MTLTTTKPFIKTLCTTLACVIASSALAIDDPFEIPEPEDEPEQPPRPDLVAYGLSVELEYDGLNYRSFKTQFTVANIGDADIEEEFVAQLGWKVIASNDPAKYPVGYTEYAGAIGATWYQGLKAFDTVLGGDLDSLYIPKSVTAVEVYVIMDRQRDHVIYGYDYEGTWLDDTGMAYIGDIWESCESNNVYMGKTLYFPDYNPDKPANKPTIISRPKLEVRQK